MSTDPTICTVAFASFICRPFSKHHSVLMADDSVLCEAADHKVIMILSYFVVVFFAFGTPVAFGGILIKKARKYEKCVRSGDNLFCNKSRAATRFWRAPSPLVTPK